MNKKLLRKFICICGMVAVFFASSSVANAKQASKRKAEKSTPTYITANEFIKRLVTKMKLEVKKDESLPYISAAFEHEILKDGDIEDYNKKITRTDCAVLLERADQYLHKEHLESKLLETILEKRISDIKKIDKSKRDAVASVYGKGIIKGYNNGKCTQDREFRGHGYVTKKTANRFIDIMRSKKKRAKLSPDGQLIRTTKLPKNADKWPYILASFPNEFYEKKFEFNFVKNFDEKTYPFKRLETWCYPYEVKKIQMGNLLGTFPAEEKINAYLDRWVERTETFVNQIFNVDYRTINKKWVDNVLSAAANCDGRPTPRQRLNTYIKNMKKYKTVIKTAQVTVEPSSLYRSIEGFGLRVYVKYKVSAIKIPKDISEFIYCQFYYMPNLKNNKWNEGYFDIFLIPSNGFTGDGEDLAPDLFYTLYDDKR